MKIISDFVDYYVHFQVVHASYAPSIVYMRKTHDIDVFTSMKVQEDLSLDLTDIKRFSDKILSPSWTITPFIIGASGRFNRGVEFKYNDTIEHSYTITGAYHIPRKLGIDVTPEIAAMIDKHFECPFFNNLCVFKTVGAPVFVITFNSIGMVQVIANPCLKDLGYPKACMSSEIFERIRAFIDNFLIPCDGALPHTKETRRVPRIIGLDSSGWALHDGMPKGY